MPGPVDRTAVKRQEIMAREETGMWWGRLLPG